MARSEHGEQAALIQWRTIRCHFSGLPEFARFAIPNAAKRSFKLAAYMKAEGLRSGIPDLMLAAASPRAPDAKGLFIEMKIGHAKPTVAQANVHDYLRRAGYHVVVAWGFEDAKRAIMAYLKSESA